MSCQSGVRDNAERRSGVREACARDFMAEFWERRDGLYPQVPGGLRRAGSSPSLRSPFISLSLTPFLFDSLFLSTSVPLMVVFFYLILCREKCQLFKHRPLLSSIVCRAGRWEGREREGRERGGIDDVTCVCNMCQNKTHCQYRSCLRKSDFYWLYKLMNKYCF